MALKMAGLLTPPPPELAGDEGVAVRDARALAIIAASALAFRAALDTEAVAVPTAVVEPDVGGSEAECPVGSVPKSNSRLDCVTTAPPMT